MDSLSIRESIILSLISILEEKVPVSGSFPDSEESTPFVVVSKQGVTEITTKSNGLLGYNEYSGLKKWLDSGMYHARISVYSENDEQGEALAYKIKRGLEMFVPEYYKQGEPLFKAAKDPSVPMSVHKGKTKLWMTDMIVSFYYEAICEEEKKH